MELNELNIDILKDYKNVQIVDEPQVQYKDKTINLVRRKFKTLELFLEYLHFGNIPLMFVWKILKRDDSEFVVVKCAIPE